MTTRPKLELEAMRLAVEIKDLMDRLTRTIARLGDEVEFLRRKTQPRRKADHHA